MQNKQYIDNALVQALQKVVEFLESRKISYMIIGGIATSIYGYPRQTFDIDIKVHTEDESLAAFIQDLLLLGEAAVDDPSNFVKQTQVIPIIIDDVRIDLILAQLEYEKEAIKRSHKKEIYGVQACVSSVEDLIIQKAVSEREKDWLDIKELIRNQKENLNWNYLLNHTKELADFLSDQTIFDRIRQYKNEE
jgi:hypothetical protein